MREHRDEFRIIVDVLNYIKHNKDNNAVITRIMYASRLTYARTKEIMQLLYSNGLVDYSINTYGQSSYVLTDRGMQFRNLALDALEMISS